ncbi:hypothetical protein AN221_02020 [Streptomyces nanshensis]|uniref:Uncharacterized protein n=1 Tax=Streptomyces nanshensis TaxID=518642 RepID=A0A1E7M1S0_9ACTN|nr:hypothetical protein AN221_02020 [Streptomyces nanshensis]
MLRGRGQQLAGRPHQPQPVVLAPDQGLFPQRRQRARQRGGDRRPRVVALLAVVEPVAGEEREQRVVRGRVRGHRQRLGGLQREPVQMLQRADHGGPGSGPGGELRDVVRHGVEEVGAGTQQPGQRFVAPGAQGFGERARWCGRPHPSHVSR